METKNFYNSYFILFLIQDKNKVIYKKLLLKLKINDLIDFEFFFLLFE
jgi:hypothetical protein